MHLVKKNGMAVQKHKMTLQELSDLVELIEARARYYSYFGVPKDLEKVILLQDAFIENHVTEEQEEPSA